MPHWWLAVPAAQIIYNGKSSLSSRLYRSRDGELILRGAEPKEHTYWITPKDKKVFSANRSNFTFFSFAALVKHNDQYGVDMEDIAKIEVNPKIVGGDNFIEFTSARKRRIRVSW